MNPTIQAPKSNRSHLMRLSALGAFVLAILAMVAFGGSYLTTLEQRLLSHAIQWGVWVDHNTLIYAVLFILIYTLVSLFGLPLSALLSLGGGMVMSLAFGFWLGGFFSALLVWVSVVFGSWGLFEFVRRFGASSFDTVAGPYINRFRQGFERDQFFYMLASRFTPLPPSIMTVVPAILGANRGQFILAAALGFIPGILVYAVLGAKLGELLAAREDGEALSFSTVANLNNIWPIFALLAFSLLPLIIRRFMRRDER